VDKAQDAVNQADAEKIKAQDKTDQVKDVINKAENIFKRK